MGSFWYLVELSSISINLKPGLRLGHFQEATMSYIEDGIIFLVFIGIVTGMHTYTPPNKNCDIIHEAGVPAHMRCENY
jgi:hypothetical protein